MIDQIPNEFDSREGRLTWEQFEARSLELMAKRTWPLSVRLSLIMDAAGLYGFDAPPTATRLVKLLQGLAADRAVDNPSPPQRQPHPLTSTDLNGVAAWVGLALFPWLAEAGYAALSLAGVTP